MVTDDQRAGHALRIREPKVAEAAVAELYRRRPDLHDRYGPDGWRYCVRDVGFHVQSLAASLEFADPGRFVEYVHWARGVMAAHGVPPADFLASLHTLRAAIAAMLPPGPADAACRHIDAALAAWDREPSATSDR